ncbi:MAG: hypothetical protein KBD16_03550, partial [Candidatus Pacebacteria bacterium]|nr:hypothetical protein [Candidatus Paceibacterota bacterium]
TSLGKRSEVDPLYQDGFGSLIREAEVSTHLDLPRTVLPHDFVEGKGQLAQFLNIRWCLKDG